MSKFLSKLSIITLVLTLAVSFVGCGGGGGGGGGGGDVDPIAGYWYVEKAKPADGQPIEFPCPVVVDGVECDREMILGFVEKKMYNYTKLSADHPETGEKVSHVSYKPDEVKSYTIDGNKAKYEGGTLTFTITGNSATFIMEDENGKTTLSVYKVNASAVEGAVPEDPEGPDDPSGPSNAPEGYWKLISMDGSSVEGSKPQTYPGVLDLAEATEDITGKIYMEEFWVFVEGKFYKYIRVQFEDVSSGDAAKVKQLWGFEDGETYYQLLANYTVDGNIVSYISTEDYEGDAPEVTMEFQISGGTVTITKEGPGFDEDTIVAERVDDSITNGALQMPEQIQ